MRTEGDDESADDIGDFLDILFGPLPKSRKCMNCGERFDPHDEGTYWYVCSEKCGHESAKIFNKQKGLGQ
jgi:DNA-directed RNA polymerase subunit RPC12/RpoP